MAGGLGGVARANTLPAPPPGTRCLLVGPWLALLPWAPAPAPGASRFRKTYILQISGRNSQNMCFAKFAL